MSAICDGCQKTAMYTVKIGQMTVCEECTDKAKSPMYAPIEGVEIMDPFDLWMEEVDKEVIKMSGVSVHDLPDVALRDNFDDGTPPDEMAEIALKEAGFPG